VNVVLAHKMCGNLLNTNGNIIERLTFFSIKISHRKVKGDIFQLNIQGILSEVSLVFNLHVYSSGVF
jgi:hypothetical protein